MLVVISQAALIGATLVAIAVSVSSIRGPRRSSRAHGWVLIAAAAVLLSAALTRGIDSVLRGGSRSGDQALLLSSAALVAVALLLARRETSGDTTQSAGAGAIDGLTRVASHRAFQDRLLHECDRAYRFGDGFTLLLVDLDQFQLINNRQGHTTGDRVLLEIAGRLSGLIRDIDLCARYGGDQFGVILPHTFEKGAVQTAERLRQQIAAWTFLAADAGELRLTASVGIAFYPEDGANPPDLVAAAKKAVRSSKTLGGNQILLHRELPGTAEGGPNVHSLPSSSGYGTIVRSLAAAVDIRDRYTHSHSHLVSELSAATARRMGLRSADVRRVSVGALLHDVGKIGVPDAVLSKESSLTAAEWDAIRQHPVLGKTILEQAPELHDVVPAVLHHQERWDGTGYPARLAGEDIPLPARIISAADAYHAIRSDRPYRPGRTHDEALAELCRCAGSQFDPRVVTALTGVLEADPGLRGLFAPAPEAIEGAPWTDRAATDLVAAFSDIPDRRPDDVPVATDGMLRGFAGQPLRNSYLRGGARAG